MNLSFANSGYNWLLFWRCRSQINLICVSSSVRSGTAWHKLNINYFFQSKSIQKPVNLFQKSSNPSRRGNLGSSSGPGSLPVRCECVCTCGDPVPPSPVKPVRRVMFSDDTSQPCSCHQSTPAVSGQCEEEEDSSSAMPNNHYKSPHEVDGEYSYAYRWDNYWSYPPIILTTLPLSGQCINTTPGHFSPHHWTVFFIRQYSWKFYPSPAQNNPQHNKLNQQERYSVNISYYSSNIYIYPDSAVSFPLYSDSYCLLYEAWTREWWLW